LRSKHSYKPQSCDFAGNAVGEDLARLHLSARKLSVLYIPFHEATQLAGGIAARLADSSRRIRAVC